MPGNDIQQDVLINLRLVADSANGAVSARLIQDVEALANKAAAAVRQAGQKYAASAELLQSGDSGSSETHGIKAGHFAKDVLKDAAKALFTKGVEKCAENLLEKAGEEGAANRKGEARGKGFDLAEYANAKEHLEIAPKNYDSDKRIPAEGVRAAFENARAEKRERSQETEQLQAKEGEFRAHKSEISVGLSEIYRARDVPKPRPFAFEEPRRGGPAHGKEAWERFSPHPKAEANNPEHVLKDRKEHPQPYQEQAKVAPSSPFPPVAAPQAAIEKSGAAVATAIETKLVNAILARDQRLQESIRRAVDRINREQNV